MFKRTVVACKDSDEGSDAVALGEAIASATGGGLSLVCVYPSSLFPAVGTSDTATFREQAETTLRNARDAIAPQALVDTVEDAFVPRALRTYAARWHAGIVIVGSDPLAPVGDAAIGRRSRQLLYDAPFTLALARRGLHQQSVDLTRIGVGYDGGPEAQAALAFAAELSRAAGSELAIHTVVEGGVRFTTEKWIGSDYSDEMWEARRQSAHAEAQAAVSALDVLAEVTSSIGDPGRELRAFSKRVDLVLVGSRRWGPIARLVLGSVGETLIAQAHCSIMIVPRPQTPAP